MIAVSVFESSRMAATVTECVLVFRLFDQLQIVPSKW